MAQDNPITLARQLEDWAQSRSNERYFRDGQLQQIEAALEDPRRDTQLSIAAWMLGTWRLATGQVRVLQGDAGGFDEVRLGAALQRTSLEIRAGRKRQTRQGEVPDLPPMHAAHASALALALDDPEAEHLLEAVRTLPDAFFGEAPYPLFVRELLIARAGGRPVASPRLGPYAEVFLHWTGDEALLARRLADLLDHHLAQTSGRGDFAEPGVRLYPAEIFALRSVRRALELPMPRVEHALLFTNLGTMAPRGPWPEDELLRRLRRRVART